MYHGTDRKCAQLIIKENSIKPSRGEEHWLGDGIYLYKEKFYVARWIILLYKKLFKNYNNIIQNLFNHFTILKILYNCEEDRIFNINERIEHFNYFHEAKKCCKKIIEQSAIINEDDFADGIVLNFLFEELNFGYNYDIVVGLFSFNNDLSPDIPSRLGSRIEKQICIKNPHIISSIVECNDDFNTQYYFEEFMKFNELNKQSSLNRRYLRLIKRRVKNEKRKTN